MTPTDPAPPTLQTLAGVPIHSVTWGGAGARVVLVHGGVQGGSAGGERAFGAQRALAAEGWRLVVPDRPGHGQSPAPGRPDDAEADALWLDALMGDGAHLVGHSFGACVILAAAARRPEAVRSLTLIEPAMHRLAAMDRHVLPFLLRLRLAALLAPTPAKRAARVMAVLGVPAEVRARSGEAELTRFGKAFTRARIPDGDTLRAGLAVVRDHAIPLLSVSGGWSNAFDATAARAARLGGGRHFVAPSPHHFPQAGDPSFNALLSSFLRAADARSAA